MDKPVLIIKTGSSLPEIIKQHGDFEQLIAALLPRIPHHTVSVTTAAKVPEVDHWCCAIITGSHHMVTDPLPWLADWQEWLRSAAQAALPVLGICFGHQLIAATFGGTVDHNPLAPEFGLVTITTTPAKKADPVFSVLPDRFSALVSHFQSVITLPETAVPLARSQVDAYQAFRVQEVMWGVQFHPEFQPDIVRKYIDYHANTLTKMGLDPRRLKQFSSQHPRVKELIPAFVHWAVGKSN